VSVKEREEAKESGDYNYNLFQETERRNYFSFIKLVFMCV
jgi:hypothetical protein